MNRKSFWVSGVMMFCICMLCLVDSLQAGYRGRRTRISEQPQQPQQRVTKLPEDGRLPTVTIMHHDDWTERPAEKALIEKWRELPDWQERFQGNFHWVDYPESSEAYQQRMKEDNPILPAIVAQDADGKVIYKDHGGEALTVKAIAFETPTEAPEECKNCRRSVHKSVDVDVDKGAAVNKPNISVLVERPPVVPDKVGIREKETESGFWQILIVGCVLSFVAAFAVMFAIRVRQTP